MPTIIFVVNPCGMLKSFISCSLILFISSLFLFSSCGNGKKSDADKIGDTLSILSNLDLLIAEDDDNPELYYDRSMYHFEQENVFSGRADIVKAIELDSTHAKYYNLLADYNLLMSQIPEVKKNLTKALALEPENTDALLKYAEFQLYMQDYPLVFENVNKALKVNKFLAKGYFIKGMAYTEMKDTLMAISSFQTCVEQDPEYYHAHMQLGFIFAAKNEPICLTYFNNAIRVNPEKPEAYYAMGFYYQNHGQINEALQSYNNMLNVSPGNAAALYNLGYINLVYIKNYDDAIKWFSEVVRIDPRYADAYYNRGRCYELLNNKDAAKKDFENAIKVDPDHQLSAQGLKRVR